MIYDGHIHSENLPLKLGITDDCQHINRYKTALYHSEQNDDEHTDCADTNTRTMEYVQKHGMPYNTGALWNNLNLTTTFYTNDLNTRASTHQDEWILVDYIFYTKYTRRTLGPLGPTSPTFSSLQLLANFQLPTKQDCQNAIGPIPNYMYGSDHFAMASEFVLLMR